MSIPEPPQNVEAEQAVLGSILLNRDAIVAVAAWLLPDYFYMQRHAQIYEAMLACYNRRVPPDTRTVTDELRRRDQLDTVGGVLYLSELVEAVPTSYHVEYYARIVERTALLRKLIEAGGKIAALGYDEAQDLDITLDRAETTLFEVSQRRAGQDFIHIGQVIDAYYEQINYLQEHRGEVVGVPTAFRDLDQITGGLQRSDLIILAARPSVGKTSFAMSVAYNVALVSQATVGVFSLEMSRDQLVQRLISMDTGIDTHRLRIGQLREEEMERVIGSMGRLASAAIYIEDTPGLSVMEVRSKARRLQSQAGIDLVVIDYLQLMQGRRSDNRVQEVSEISRGLKALARELNVPVIALSQLSRAVEGRQSHVPMLSDLRESGCLTGETLVYLPDEGTYRRIDSLVDTSGFNVLALNTDTWKLEQRQAVRVFTTGRKSVFRMTTRLGKKVRATANHKFLTIQGWKRLDELAPGMRLALPRRLSGPVMSTMSVAELALLGHLIGDGCTLPRQPIHYTTNDITLAEIVVDLAGQMFGDKVLPRINREREWYQVYLSAGYRLTHGVRNPVAKWLDDLGVFGLRSHEKYVPEKVFSQPEASIALFLRHLWSTDGCIHLGSGKRTSIAIYYATSSARLAEQVQSLLLRLGITAAIKSVSQQHKGRDQYHVIVSGKSDMEHFIAMIGGLGQLKAKHQIAIQEHIAQRVENTNRDVVPREVWRDVAIPAMQREGITTRQLHAALGNAYCGTALYKQNLSRDRAARLAGVVHSDTLARLAMSDVYWDEIVSIEPDGEEEVYDVTVEGLHNFVANDIVVHNSIEQDADIVMFIYREELYDKETDKKGIAEIHIAKHRNGPIGMVPMRFEASTTRFMDLTYRSPEGY
ncbi:MAG TPA: replicative DNA helicase [Roseiflexaceae bacterium]|nr:replicative DNA helicase [Roseiflexaceae bacterium]